jgi:hypothetical protein
MAELLPDEAAAFRACGAADPVTARQLRVALGDVEHLLTWHRAGFDAAEVLRLRADGVTDVQAALAQRKAAAKSLAAALLAPDDDGVPPPATVIAMEAGTAASKPAPASKSVDAGAKADKPKRSAGPKADWTPEGGAWIGWSVFESQDGALPSPGADVLSRPLAGGRMDVLIASEGVALPTLAFSATELHVEEGWQESLDAYRAAAGQAPKPGQWQLVAMAPLQAKLFWGLHFRASLTPWGQAIDFDAHETWLQRWARKAEDFGEAGLPVTCVVGRTASRGWFFAAPGSELDLKEPGVVAVERTEPEKAWREAVERFCQIMGLGKQQAGWHLLALDPSEAS